MRFGTAKASRESAACDNFVEQYIVNGKLGPFKESCDSNADGNSFVSFKDACQVIVVLLSADTLCVSTQSSS